MPISIDRYVAITSGVIGAQAVAQRELIGLRFSTDPRVPIDAVITMDKDDAGPYFGNSTPEAIFANQYFAYISPAPVSQAQRLRFAPWADVARAARIFGAKGSYSLPTFTAISSGNLNLTLGAETFELTGINLSAAASLADVASAVQTAIRAHTAGGADWTAAVVSYDAVGGAFNLVGGATGNAAVGVAAAAGGTDVGAAMGWITGAIDSPGSVAQTPLEALQAVEQITDSFGSFSYPTVTVAQALEVAQYNAALNVKYMFLISATKANAQDFYAALQALASVGVVINATAGEYKESLPAAIMAATNYDRRNATVNYMYRQGPFTADVTTDAEANTFDPIRANYYGDTSSAGQRVAFFQRGFLMGGATAPLDMNVHANEQWLKAFLLARFLSLQISVGKIPANDDGRGMIRAVLQEGIEKAKTNGTISVGKVLTTAQQIAVTQLTGDPDAWREVQTAGYWCDVQIVAVTGPSNITEYVAVYTLAYSKNDVVRKIEGSHNLV
jgi:hypothetical protein